MFHWFWCVVGMIEREGKVKATKVSKNKLKSKDLQKMAIENIDIESSTLMTDKYKGYSRMNRLLKRSQVNHKKEYVSGKDIHTNTIESFWAILKRRIIGQFHWVSKKYLNKYIDEFCFRYNEKGSDTTFGNMLDKILCVI